MSMATIHSLRLMNTQRLRPFLSWHRQHQQERKGTVVLLIIVLTIYVIRFCITQQTKVIIENAQTLQTGEKESDTTHQPFSNTPHISFTPKHSRAEEWQRAGLSEKKAKSIMKYLQHGGSINSAKDLDKIYCLNEQEKEMLKTQLQFTADTFATPAATRVSYQQPTIVELNSADTLQLKKLPGIGKWFARKIIERRDMLGGYYDEQQLLEVYRMTQGKIDTLYDYVSINTQNIRRFRINHVHADTLALHPYFRRKLAHTLCSYRDKHGPYRDIEALSKAAMLDSMQLQRLSYYLRFD